MLSLLVTHEGDPLFFATRGPQWQRHDPGMDKQSDGTIFFGLATDPLSATTRFSRFRLARILYPVTAYDVPEPKE